MRMRCCPGKAEARAGAVRWPHAATRARVGEQVRAGASTRRRWIALFDGTVSITGP